MKKTASLSNKITILGSGYVGLVQGTCLAEVGHHVKIYDIDKEKIASLKNRQSTIYEPGLDDLIQKNSEAGRLHFTTDLSKALDDCDLCFICVPTPPNKGGSSDLSRIYSVTDEIIKHVKRDLVVAIKSTVPPGTAKAVATLIQENIPVHKISVVSNPEFTQEGLAVVNCMDPIRVVIGHTDSDSAELLGKVYSKFPIDKKKIIYMDLESAEMAKYASNILHASRVSMINEISIICEKVGANMSDVQTSLVLDPKLGYAYLNAGIGFGGSCLPKDVLALTALAQNLDFDVPMLKAVTKANESARNQYIHKISEYFRHKKIKSLTIGIWGIAFKSGTDDVRSSPAIEIAQHLLQRGATLRIYDPLASKNAKPVLAKHEKIIWTDDPYSAVKNADALCVLTEDPSFQSFDFTKVKEIMKGEAIFDGRNILSKENLPMLQFKYFGVGI